MRTALVLMLAVVPSAAAVACVTSTSGETEQTTDALTLLELTCTSSSMTFDVSPAFGGVALEGKLAISAIEQSLFVCRPPADHAAGGNGDRVLDCNERPQSFHPGTWKVAVTKNGGAYTAMLDKGDNAAGVAFTCSTPGGDAGSPIPTYAEVGPIIDNACGGCHESTFDSIENIKLARERMLGMILSGAMPRRQPTWKDSADGKLVINFLQNSPELK